MTLKFSFLFMMLIASFNTHAQTSSPLLEVKYYHYTDLNNNVEDNHEATLWLNMKESVYFFQDMPKKNTLKMNESGGTTMVKGDEDGNAMYKNISKNILVYKDTYRPTPYNVIVKDSIPKIKWMITDSTKTIGGVLCTYAIGKIGCRTYDTWFTRTVPVPTGPYILGGLPGLILEAKSRDKQVQFLFQSMKQLPKDNTLSIQAPSKGVATFSSIKEYQEACLERVKKTTQKSRAAGRNVTVSIRFYGDTSIEKCAW